MKKTGILLFGISMLALTGTLFYAAHRLPFQESGLQRQEALGAEQKVQKMPEQTLTQPDEELRSSQQDCYAFLQLTDEEQ